MEFNSNMKEMKHIGKNMVLGAKDSGRVWKGAGGQNMDKDLSI